MANITTTSYTNITDIKTISHTLYPPSTNRSELGSFNLDPELNHTRNIVGWVCITAYFVVFIPSLVMFWIRRNKFPLSKRFPYQTMTIQCTMTVWVISNVARLINLPEFPCAAIIWGEAAGVCVSLLLLNFRLLGLAYRYYWNMAQVDEFWRPNWKALKNDNTPVNVFLIKSTNYFDDSSSDQESFSGSNSSVAASPLRTARSPSLSISVDRASGIAPSEKDSRTGDVASHILGCVPIHVVKKIVSKMSWMERMEYSGPLFLFVVVIFLVPHAFFYATQPELREAPYVACSKDLDLPIFIVYSEAAILYFILILLGLFILPKVVDSIDYRTEMMFIVVLCTGCMGTYAAIVFVPFLQDYDKWVFPLYQIALTPLSMIIIVVQITLPVLLTYYNDMTMLELLGFTARKKNSSKSAVAGGIDALNPVDAEHEKKMLEALTMKEVLGTPKLIKAFQKFLQSEFAQESLYFLVEAEEFRYMVWKLGKEVYKRRSVIIDMDTKSNDSIPDYSYRVPALAMTKIDPIPLLTDAPDDGMVPVATLPSQSFLMIGPSTTQLAENNELVLDMEALTKAFEIVRRYLLPSSPLELNIPANILSPQIQFMIQISNSAGKYAAEKARSRGFGLTVDVFDDLQRHIFETLRLGSWPRFKRSSFLQAALSTKSSAAK